MDAREGLSHYRRKAQLQGFNLGDTVRVKGREKETGLVEVVEIRQGDEPSFTVVLYDEDGDRYDQEYDLFAHQMERVGRPEWRMPVPKIDLGSKVMVTGDHPLAGAFGTADYAYNKIVSGEDADQYDHVEGNITGWRYVIDFEAGLRGRIDNSESIHESYLKPMSESEYAGLTSVAPEITGEEGIVLE